ncbi:putative APO protein 3, mitochondrial [Zostera marina]|uniref:Putative APO protein 3, mitochondrial n=1 Tax=Zostera marina TaxID=29655 RepID=A0A0K9NQL3_ZOSMR|nr:putative APO protein 3, mitochondrial [Zostera marina]
MAPFVANLPTSIASSLPTHHRLDFFLPIRYSMLQKAAPYTCICGVVQGNQGGDRKRANNKGVIWKRPQNVDLPAVLPKNKKKPYPISIKKIQRISREDKKLAQMGIEKPLEPPNNGMLLPHLIPVAHEVLEEWKVLIKGLSQLMHVVPVYGCRHCPDVHIGPVGHRIPDCRGSKNVNRKSLHAWIRGSINDVLVPIESYHMFDPFGQRIKHETRFKNDRIPAVVELCIQAGIEIPQYPCRRRTKPIRILGKKIIDRGEYVEEPKPSQSEESMALLTELDTYGALDAEPPTSALEAQVIAQRTVKAYSTVRRGLKQLMKKYTVKACGYCSEVHVGPWGHNAKLCGEFKHQWRDGKHGWQNAVLDEVMPPNYVWHVRDSYSQPLIGRLKRFYGKAPAVVEVCVQAGASIPDAYKSMMRLDIIIPEVEEAQLVA